MGSLDKIIDKNAAGLSLEQLRQASPSSLKGLTGDDAQELESALGIATIEQMARNRFFANARAVMSASGRPAYDTGPPYEWADLFAAAPLNHYRNHPSARFRIDFGPVYYRGRLDGTARILIVGQDPSSDEIITQRAFVGRAGQRVQGYLRKLGITRAYMMFNTFLFSVFQTFNSELRNISLEPEIRDYRNTLLDKAAAENPLEAVFAVGAAARHAVENWPGGANHSVFELTHPTAPDHGAIASWNAHLGPLGAAIAPDPGAVADLTPYGAAFQDADHAPIPRFDLPFGIPDWHGTGGTRSHRSGNQIIEWAAP
jgi:hypothetical protein